MTDHDKQLEAAYMAGVYKGSGRLDAPLKEPEYGINVTDCAESFRQWRESTDLVPAAEPTQWYTRNEMRDYLLRHRYSEQIADELADMWAGLLEGALKRGRFEAALSPLPEHRDK